MAVLHRFYCTFYLFLKFQAMAKSEDTEATANSEDSEVMERWEDLVDTDWDTENPYMEERASIIGEMMISVS